MYPRVSVLKNRYKVEWYVPGCERSVKSFYFLVCERFPLFAMLKNRCGKISRAKARRFAGNFPAKSPIYKIQLFSKVD
jgi:hypothetical protein